ncbi:MFS transporter [Thalassotalea euphylliae]|uniref:3-methyl-2-oxobutanoate dehydrogenase (2-methylpropanoyl-transferring) n=1 Tax=Thalassotalea euphylliae TaxID=1655234 RepID=A0A3E0TM41_9GAMM|nr:thiamine pyrophosphate-dependent enzyme [Thalassotalea euphylliae]REL25624.1 MFS transporter [Thalassotalea euphylliae]
MSDRNQIVKENFARCVRTGALPALTYSQSPQSVGLSDSELVDMFSTQVMSRHLDLQSRVMQKLGQSFYTIGSAGHEGNAAYGKAFRADDMAFLHYRSGAFCLQRAKEATGHAPLYEMLLSYAASSEDPVSGGRHKVLGSKAHNIPPQTSTIASHLPKAMGTAFSIGLAQRLNFNGKLASDSIVICSFGDASANHSTALGAINSAAWCAYQSIPMPIVFICEDNGIGISTATPQGWIAANFKQRAGIHYLYCDGLNLMDTYQAARNAAKIARAQQKPVFLHVRMVRLLGHAGSDTEFSYRDLASIEETERQDPLLHSAKLLLNHGIMSTAKIIELYEATAAHISDLAEQVAQQPKLSSPAQVMASLIPQAKSTSELDYQRVSQAMRDTLFAHEQHNLAKPQHLAKLLNWTLMDALAELPNMVMLGEDIAKKGGVYNVTSKLNERFGSNRVMNTLLDEQSILGGAIGLAHNGFLPIPEIQFLAYVHNAEDQIRGEAATLSFFSNQQFTNPMVIRIAGLAYQKGFGGHFHNDNSFAVFRDIPGVILACPSTGADGVQMLRTCIKLAHEQQRVVVFLEPIALYMTKDLLPSKAKSDGLWMSHYHYQALAEHTIDMGIKVHPPINTTGATSLSIVTYGNGCYLSRQAQVLLAEQGIDVCVVDLRFLAPLDEAGLIHQLSECEKVLIVDECRANGSISEALVTLLTEHTVITDIKRICAQDSFIPLGSAAYQVLPSTQEIVDTVIKWLR